MIDKTKELYRKLCHVDPISENDSVKEITTDEAIARLRKKLMEGGSTGLNTDGTVLILCDSVSAASNEE